MQFCRSIFVVVIVFGCAGGLKQPNLAENRTTIVHLFEWTWAAVAKECVEFLAPNGYGGVQISPPTESRVIAKRPWWERYQPISYLLSSRSGNESELGAMIATCNRVGVRIYVDAVINHMTGAQAGESVGLAGSVGHYDQRKYPAVPYGPDDFNAPCQIGDYRNPRDVRNCQLTTLLDLNQRRPHVRNSIVRFMNRLIDMGVAGFRIDAAKHMWPEDLQAIYTQLQNLNDDLGLPKSARPYMYQEVIDLGNEGVKKTEYNGFGDVVEFRYSNDIGRIFRGKDQLKWLHNWGPEWGLLPSGDSVVFVDNHDNQRGHGAGGENILTHQDGPAYKLASIFMLAHPFGEVVRVMSSYAFQDTDQGPPATSDGQITPHRLLPSGQCDTAGSGWVCEHRWPEIANMVRFRNAAGNAALGYWWDNGGNQIAFGRGNVGFVALNMDLAVELRAELASGLAAGSYCDIITGTKASTGRTCTGKSFIVGANGRLLVDLPKGPSAMAIYIGSKL